MTNTKNDAGTANRLIAAVDFETFYDAKAGYSLTNMTPYEYVRDPRFNAYLVAVAFNDGRPTFVGNPKKFDWSLLDDALLLAHNAAFDGMVLLRLEELGIVPKREREWLDTADMVAFLGVTRNLKTACRELLDLDVSKAVRSAMDGKTDLDLNREELEALYEYGGSDAEECLQLFLKYGDKWPQIERDISTQTRNAAWRGINVNDEAVVEGINVLSIERDKAAAQLPWVARGEKPGSLPALADEVKKLGLPVPPSFRKNDPRFLEWQEKYKDQCPFLQARIVYAGTTPHIARLQNLHDHLNEGMYHSDVRYFGTHCLSAGHQVLTKKGWIKIEDWVKVGGDILQWDPASQRLAGFLPAEPFEADNTEDTMIEFKSDKVRCKMTLGHKVPVIIHEPRNKTFPTKTVSMTAEGVYRTVMRGEDLRVAYVSPVALTFDYGNDIYNHMRTDDAELNSSNVRFVAAEKKVYCAKTQTGFFVCRYMGTVFVSGNTGRTASGSNGGRETETASKINLLNLPKAPVHGVDMRGMFIPRPGHKFIIYDYASIEHRMIRWLAGDNTMIKELTEVGNLYGAAAVRMGWCSAEEGRLIKHTNKPLYQLAKAACLTGESLILTKKPLTSPCYKRIIDLTINDLVWDGTEWVHHQGVKKMRTIHEQELITSGFGRFTKDHKVYTGGRRGKAIGALSDGEQASALAWRQANTPISRWHNVWLLTLAVVKCIASDTCSEVREKAKRALRSLSVHTLRHGNEPPASKRSKR